MSILTREKKVVDTMKERMRRRKSPNYSSSSSSWLVLYVFLFGALLFMVAFSNFCFFGVSFKPELSSTWKSPAMEAISEHALPTHPSPITSSVNIHHAVTFPDSILLFTNHSSNLTNIQCLYHYRSNSNHKENPLKSYRNSSFIRCPTIEDPDFSISLSTSTSPPTKPFTWDRLAYSSILDTYDNTTLVFAKGLNLRPRRLSDPNRYECVFGYNFKNPKYQLYTPVISAAQEIFRCSTPRSILNHITINPPFVSIKTKGRGSFTLPSMAHPNIINPSIKKGNMHKMCICTMVHNQARFIPEWLHYHSTIGVQKFLIYDNNSEDDLQEAVKPFTSSVGLYEWPWIKTQEAGFAHCALRARDTCEWVGFIDVDEFMYLPSNLTTIHDVIGRYSNDSSVGELRTDCHTFGPSGRKEVPQEGVVLGYTCRMGAPERHKSIVRPDMLNPSLINIVHHFHLKEGVKYVYVENKVMAINHYKYQVWDIFKEKFERRVATYVVDWKEEENVGSKDRAPGLGTKPIEPPDWAYRFCEVNDTGLSDWVRDVFTDHNTGLLPW